MTDPDPLGASWLTQVARALATGAGVRPINRPRDGPDRPSGDNARHVDATERSLRALSGVVTGGW